MNQGDINYNPGDSVVITTLGAQESDFISGEVVDVVRYDGLGWWILEGREPPIAQTLSAQKHHFRLVKGEDSQ